MGVPPIGVPGKLGVVYVVVVPRKYDAPRLGPKVIERTLVPLLSLSYWKETNGVLSCWV